MITQKMEFKYDDAVAAASGILGGILGVELVGISWDTIMMNLGQLLWLGVIAAFSGAMGVLGKYAINQLIKKYTKK